MATGTTFNFASPDATGNQGYRPAPIAGVFTATTVLPLVVAGLHTGISTTEARTLWYDFADTYAAQGKPFAVVLMNYGVSPGLPNSALWGPASGGVTQSNELNYLQGVNGPNGGQYQIAGGSIGNSIGIPGWATALGADPMKVMGVGYSATGSFWLRFLWNNTGNPSQFKVIAVMPTHTHVLIASSVTAPGGTPSWSTPMPIFSVVGTGSGEGNNPWQGNGTTYATHAWIELIGALNGWDSVSPTPTEILPNNPSTGHSYVRKFDYGAHTPLASTRYYLVTGGTAAIHNQPETVANNGFDGGGHQWSNSWNALDTTSQVGPGDSVWDTTDEAARWFMSTVLAPISNVVLKNQTSKARVKQIGLQKTQTAHASVGALNSATHTATARISNLVFDGHKNFAYSTVATPPSPATSGATLIVAPGDGTKFPVAPFNVTIWPPNTNPNNTNAEIARCTLVTTDTLTLTRATEGTSARTVVAGDQISATISAKLLTDIESQLNTNPTTLGNSPQGTYADLAVRLAALEFANMTTNASTARTLSLSDASDVINFTSGSATTITIPPASSVPFLPRTTIVLRAGGAGQLNVVATLPAVVNSRGSLTHSAGQFAWLTLVNVSTDVWDLLGDLA